MFVVTVRGTVKPILSGLKLKLEVSPVRKLDHLLSINKLYVPPWYCILCNTEYRILQYMRVGYYSTTVPDTVVCTSRSPIRIGSASESRLSVRTSLEHKPPRAHTSQSIIHTAFLRSCDCATLHVATSVLESGFDSSNHFIASCNQHACIILLGRRLIPMGYLILSPRQRLSLCVSFKGASTSAGILRSARW